MENKEIKGIIHSIESFGSVDGPGVRYIVFLQGCRMRCRYCHNPDTWALNDKNSYEETPAETLKKAMRFKAYWKETGGITVSGGEALLQIDYVTELFRLAKEQGVHTTLDTSGNPFTREEPFFSKFNELLKYTDLFLLDIKHIDPVKHKDLTQWDNSNILDMAKYLSDNGKKMWIRNVLVPFRDLFAGVKRLLAAGIWKQIYDNGNRNRNVLVPGYTDGEEDLQKLSDFISSLKTVDRVEVLPYHTLGVFKWKELGIDYTLEGVSPPDGELIKKANDILKTSEYKGYLNR